MFGNPITTRYGITILPWVWTYLYKEGKGGKDQTKARGTCNGSPQFFNANNLGKTFAACLEQPTHRLTWAISAALGLICKGYDIRNAFAEAPADSYDFYMKPDEQFREWWTECLKRPPLGPNDVIPIKHALQEHLSSLNLWHKYITKMLVNKMIFQTCTHNPYLYYKFDKK